MMVNEKSSIDDIWLNVLTGRDDSDVSGQFLDKEQLEAMKEAEILREALISLESKEQAQSEDIDVEASKNRLITKLKKNKLL